MEYNINYKHDIDKIEYRVQTATKFSCKNANLCEHFYLLQISLRLNTLLVIVQKTHQLNILQQTFILGNKSRFYWLILFSTSRRHRKQKCVCFCKHMMASSAA